MSKLAIITARGGSKRIPGKNIKSFCGKPIIAYSIESAIESGIFDQVMVSTDDVEIANIAKEAGAQVPFMRSKKTSDDYATTAEVVEEVLRMYFDAGKEFDYVCCIYPTAVFVSSALLKRASELIEESGADCVMPVAPFSFPVQRSLVLDGNRVSAMFPEGLLKRSQDCEQAYHDAGQFYFLNSRSFANQKRILMDNTHSIKLSELQVQDIDTEEDWRMAEIKYQMVIENETKI